MKTKFLKKIQRRINSDIRNLNEGIKEDNVFKGRFSAKQVDRKTIPYHDGSGFSIIVFVQLKDNETGLTKVVTLEALPFTAYYRVYVAAELAVKMGTFILQDCHFEEE
jgi:hypothetical protein